MNLKDFIENKNITGFEIIPNILILNVFVDNTPYGLDVDTSNIQAGTQLSKITNFSIDNNILTVDTLSLNIETTNMLTTTENISADIS